MADYGSQMSQESTNGESSVGPGVWQALRALMEVLASTRTAIIVLAAVALAIVVGTVLPDPVGGKLVYGQLWFRVLLGLLGANLLACMLWRRRIGMARIWSLLTHLGIILVLAGAMVTLILAERGRIVLWEGHELDAFTPEGTKARGAATFDAATKVLTDASARFLTSGVSSGDYAVYGHGRWQIASVASEFALILTDGPHRDVTTASDYYVEGREVPLGFAVKLLDFRLVCYPPTDYLHLIRRGSEPLRLRVRPGKALDIPGTEWGLSDIEFVPKSDHGSVEVAMPDGKTRSIPAKVGTTHELDGKKLGIRILRSEPAFKIDIKTKRIASDTWRPINPALQVALVRDGKQGRPRWLFAKVPDFGGTGHGSVKPGETDLRFLHPAFPLLTGVVQASTGADRQRFPLRLAQAKPVSSPWDPRLTLMYVRTPSRVKEYESEVEVLEAGQVIRRHVIRVNDPLVHKGTKLSQVGYDERRLRWSRLGVTRDKGVWFVYAGFLATMVGLMGKFYLRPIIRQLRATPGALAPDRSPAVTAAGRKAEAGRLSAPD